MSLLCIFVEGGGDTRKTTAPCRAGFHALFDKILPKQRLTKQRLKIIICGSRQSAYEDFCNGLKKKLHPECDHCILLVDSEDFVIREAVWEHLKNRDGDHWKRPENASEENVYLMVQSMESWFLADREALKEFYGQGFKGNALPGQPNVELIPKQDVFEALKAATEETKTKKKYHKTKHGFPLLALLDPKKIGQASPHAMRLFRFLNPDFMSESEAKEAKLEAELNDLINDLIEVAIQESGATSLADMGKVMGILKPRVPKRADMQVVSTLVKQRLSG